MRIFLFILILTFPQLIIAQSTDFRVFISSENITIDDQLEVVFRSNKNGGIIAPDFAGFAVVFGPIQMSSTEYENINGVSRQVNYYSYQYVLKPTKEGSLTIGPASLKFAGKTYKTEPVKIKVGRAKDPAYYTENINPPFLSIELNKTTVYSGEPILLNYTLHHHFSRCEITSEDFPKINGGWLEIIEPKGLHGWQSEEVTVKGARYDKKTFKKEVFIPNTIGKIAFEPFSMTLVGQGLRTVQPYNLNSNRPVVTVKPLPDGAPASFNGATGKMKLSAKITQKQLKTNNGFDLVITISGEGNLMFVECPRIRLPGEIEKYDPEMEESIKFNGKTIEGLRRFRVPLIPRKAGNFIIPAIEFSYFDPEDKKYHELRSTEFSIAVTEGGSALSTGSNSKGEPVSTYQKLIPAGDDLVDTENLLSATPLYPALLGVMPLAFLFVVFLRRKKSAVNIQFENKKQASKFAIEKLKAAKAKLDNKELNGFYAETMKGLQHYVSNKTGLEASVFSKDKIRSTFESQLVPAEKTEEYITLIENCELAQYGMTNSGNENNIYEQSLALIDYLETILK